MARASLLGWGGAMAMLLAACGSDGGASGGGSGGAQAAADSGADGASDGPVSCDSEPPPGAPEPAALKAYTGGACPTLQAGTNTLASMGSDRQLILVLPAGYDGSKPLPLAFLWHWLGGSASDFLNIGFLQNVVDRMGFIAVIPEKKGDVQFTWPATALETDARFEEELTFFDDMLTCVTEQYQVNRSCVSTVGVSAGALWTDQLGWARSEYLSSMLSLSGGVGDGTRAWGGAEHDLPALVVWGGETDNFILNFQTLSQGLESKLTEDGHFLVECVHNCGHGVPPLAGPPGVNPIEALVEGIVGFALSHPYWLPAGESPWLEGGLPPELPPFCAIGAGNAVPRTGDCTGGISATM